MKYSVFISSFLVSLPLVSQVAALAVPPNDTTGRRNSVVGRAGRGGFGQGNAGAGQRNGQNGQNAAAKNANNNNGQNAAANNGQNAGNNNNNNGQNAAANNGNNNGQNAGNNNNGNNGQNATASSGDNSDPQQSLTLNSKVIATGFQNNGQAQPEDGQVASLTSSNNFINFCLTVPNLPITNGQQITTGSCNPAPIGTIPSVSNMPSVKFANPANGATITAGQTFNIQMNIQNIETGNFVNAQQNYFAAPQQLNTQGQIIGHSHVVIEAMTSMAQTTPTDPQKFTFFKGINTAAQNGQLTAAVDGGVPAGTYRMCTINSSSNHQPVIVPVAQHGSLDDCVYFTASGGGGGASNSAAAATASKASTKTGKNKGKGN